MNAAMVFVGCKHVQLLIKQAAVWLNGKKIGIENKMSDDIEFDICL